MYYKGNEQGPADFIIWYLATGLCHAFLWMCMIDSIRLKRGE